MKLALLPGGCAPRLSAWRWQWPGQQPVVLVYLPHSRCQLGLEATRLWSPFVALPLFSWVALAFYSCSLTLSFFICEKKL